MEVGQNNIAVPIISIILIVVTTVTIITIFAVLVHHRYNTSRKKNREDEYQLTHHMEECDYEADDQIKEDEYQINTINPEHDETNENDDEDQPGITLIQLEKSGDDSDIKPGELLKVDEDMFTDQSPQRFVPTMIKKFEKIAAGIEDDQAPEGDTEEEPGITEI